MSEPRRERKVVTVLFADLVGFTARSETLDPEDVEAILRPYHARLREELEQRGGTVEKFVGDAVMAVFGAPTAHEDDPERAVRAALAICDGIVEDGTLEVRIGVNTGEALVNIDARPDHGEGMVSGDVVNTAARLQSAAPTNGVLVGESTYRATRHVIEYREHDPVDAKGKSEPVPVWEAVEARARAGVELRAPSTPLVGRARERDLLLGVFGHSRTERSTQLVTIVGVPGIGKSRLVAELYGELEREPDLTHWRHGRSLPYGEGVAFWAFAEMVKAQAGILDTDAAADAERKLREAVAAVVGDADAAWVESRLRPLVGLETSSGDRDESFAAWRRFIEALAEQRPTVLVFEDLHWADDDLLDFADSLVDWIEDVPLLVVGTARPELLDRRPGWGGGKRNALTVSLAPLGDEDTARLISALLERHVLPAETQQALLARAGGNPLYAEQFARMLAERGDGDGELPETVQGIIAARVDSLSATEKALLLDAAVLGKTFWLGALQAIGGVERREAEERLHALQRKEFVRRERRSSVAGETEFAFAHLLVRDVAYAQLPRAERVEKHALAARWLESLAPDRSEDRAEMLAHHYLAALDLARSAGLETAALVEPARAALRDAGDRALALDSAAAAVRLYGAAVELTPGEDPDRPLLVLLREQAQFRIDSLPNLDKLEYVVTAFVAAGDPEHAAEAEMAAAQSLWLRGDRDAADEHAAHAQALIEDRPASSAKAIVLTDRARLLMLRAESVQSIALARGALELSESLGLERLRVSALVTLGTAQMNDGDPAGGETLERALAAAQAANDAREIHRACNNLAELARQQGELGEVTRLYAVAREANMRLGNLGGLRWLEGEEAFHLFFAGEWDRAAPMLDAFIAGVEAGSPHYLESQNRLVRARLRHARGDVAGALDDAERAAEAARRQKDPQAVGPTLATLGQLLVAQGRGPEAQPLADEVLSLRHPGGGFHYFIWIPMLAWLARDLGRSDEFLDIARADHVSSPWLDLGIAIGEGDLLRAADLAERLGPVFAAEARLRAAEALTAERRPAEAQVHLEQALAFYRSVGATAYVRRAEALLLASA